MYKQTIINNILSGKNQVIYADDMFEIYKNIVSNLYQPKENELFNTDYECIYIDTQKDKDIIIDAIKALRNPDSKKSNLHKLNQDKLIKLLISLLPDTRLIIVYNHMEDITNNRELLFRKLMRNKVLFVAGFQKMPPENRMPFFQIHEFVNKKEYDALKGENKIDITYFFYILITFLMVLIFLRIVSLGRIGDITSSALWFGLLVFRTFSYIGGRT